MSCGLKTSLIDEWMSFRTKLELKGEAASIHILANNLSFPKVSDFPSRTTSFRRRNLEMK